MPLPQKGKPMDFLAQQSEQQSIEEETIHEKQEKESAIPETKTSIASEEHAFTTPQNTTNVAVAPVGLTSETLLQEHATSHVSTWPSIRSNIGIWMGINHRWLLLFVLFNAVATAVFSWRIYEWPHTQTGELVVYDAQTVWQSSGDIPIFGSGCDTNTIEPGQQGIYSFVVSNAASTSKTHLTLCFSQSNPQNIPIQFRLIRDAQYSIGSQDTWINASDFHKYYGTLEKNSIARFTLEWRWYQDAATSTQLGGAYSLSISVDSKAVKF